MTSCKKNDDSKIKIGVTTGPHAMILEDVKKRAQKENLSVEIIEFSDFVLPNMALDQGEIEVNSYQHAPFLEEQIKTRGYKLKVVGKTVLMPLGIYSKKIKDLKTLSNGSTIAIPNDPTNGGRALLLLQKAGLIKLKAVPLPSLLDITENHKNLKFKEIEAPALPQILQDVTCAAINTDWVVLAGLDPKTALFKEDKDSPYVNLLVVKEGHEKNPKIKKLIKIYQTPETKKFIAETFKGAILSGW